MSALQYRHLAECMQCDAHIMTTGLCSGIQGNARHAALTGSIGMHIGPAQKVMLRSGTFVAESHVRCSALTCMGITELTGMPASVRQTVTLCKGHRCTGSELCGPVGVQSSTLGTTRAQQSKVLPETTMSSSGCGAAQKATCNNQAHPAGKTARYGLSTCETVPPRP